MNALAFEPGVNPFTFDQDRAAAPDLHVLQAPSGGCAKELRSMDAGIRGGTIDPPPRGLRGGCSDLIHGYTGVWVW